MITGEPLYSKSTIIELGLVTNYIYIYWISKMER